MRPDTDWHHVVAHIDADCFYAACERLRHPELADRPLCVLSNQNAVVVAKTYDAKARGITTGMHAAEAKRLVPEAAFLSPDFRYYGQLSRRMIAILHRYSPGVEVSSIDEAFVDMNGLRRLWGKDFDEIADEIRHAVRSEIGITVSIGIACTKTLAKMASESNKPDGSTVVPGRRIAPFLKGLPVSAIPGIGPRRAASLERNGMRTALDYAERDEREIARLLDRTGTGLWHELNGMPIYGLEDQPAAPKSVARTASMGEITGDKARIAAHLCRHAYRLVSELTAKAMRAGRLRIFLTLESLEQVAIEVRLPQPANTIRPVMEAVSQACQALHQPDARYRACGIVATQLTPEHSATPDLFGKEDGDRKQKDLMRIMGAINHRFGRHSIALAQASTLGKRNPDSVRFRYPLLTAR